MTILMSSRKLYADLLILAHSNGQHIQTFKGHRFDTLRSVSVGGLDNNQTQINYEKSIGFKKKDGRSVKDVIVGFE